MSPSNTNRLLTPEAFSSPKRKRRNRAWVAQERRGIRRRTLLAEPLEDRRMLASLTDGNLLVTANNQLLEYTTSGTLVQSFAVPFPGGRPGTEEVRDIAITSTGQVQIYNGTFDPYLSTLDPNSNTWTHDNHPGWDTVNNISYGGIDTVGTRTFVTDMRTSGGVDSGLSGIVEFNSVTGTSTRFGTGSEYRDLTVSPDGAVYGLVSPFDETVHVYDPVSHALLRTVTLGSAADHRAIAIDNSGDIYAATWNSEIRKYDGATGALLQTFNIGGGNLTDIDVSSNGQIAVGTRFSGVVLTDVSFTSTQRLNISSDTTFVTFVEASLAGGSIEGEKYVDVDGDGERDPGETPQAGVEVYLDLNRNGQLDAGEPTDITAADGSFEFNGLQDGDYVVRENVPLGYVQTSPGFDPGTFYGTAYIVGSGGQMNFVSIDGATGQVTRIGNSLSTRIHGLIQTNNGEFYGVNGFNSDSLFHINSTNGQLTFIGNFGAQVVFGLAHDPVTDTIYTLAKPTANDPVLRLAKVNPQTAALTYMGQGSTGLTGTSGLTFDTANRRVIAFDNADDQFYAFDLSGNAQLLSDVSNLNFWSLAEANQTFIHQPIGLNNNQLLRTIDPGTGQVADFVTLSEPTPMESLDWAGLSYAFAVNIAGGQTVRGLEFGNHPQFNTVSGSKFEDVNGNGVRDAGEGPLAEVAIYLDTNDNGQLDPGEPSIRTAADGSYEFTGLVPGDYVIREVVPLDYQQTAPVASTPRLFALDISSNPDRIVEMDPQTGVVMNSFDWPGADTGGSGLALGDNVLYSVDFISDRVFALDPDTGVVQGSFQLPPGSYDGMAYLDGLLYLSEFSVDDILVVDPQSGNLVRRMDIDGQDLSVDLLGGLGETGDGRLVATTASSRVIFLDRQHGAVLGQFDAGTQGQDYAATGFGGEIYLGYSGGIELIVFDNQGNRQREVNLPFPVFALGGGLTGFGAHRVSLSGGDEIAGLDFGNQSILGELSGLKFEDLDADGVRDSGEGPLAGVTIYLDQNGNGELDSGEPTTLTGSDGRYVFADLRPGEYSVREVVPGGFIQTSPGAATPRLFALDVAQTPDLIHELDPQNGQILSSFDRPGADTGATGIAYDGEHVFVVDAEQDRIFAVDPNTGQVADSMTLPPGSYDGLAIVEGRIYVLEYNLDDILVVDFEAKTVVDVLDVNGSAPQFGANLIGALGETADGTGLLASTSSNRVVEIDLQTGAIIGQLTIPNIGDFGLTGFGGELYVGSTQQGIQVFAEDGQTVRTLPTSFPVYALGGAASFSDSHDVTLEPAQRIGGLDFGNHRVNRPPVANAGGPYDVVEGGSVILDGSGSTDPDGDNLVFAWDLDNDGIFGETGAEAALGDEIGVAPVFDAALLDGPSIYNVSLRVTDPFGESSEATAEVMVINDIPELLGVDSPAPLSNKAAEGELLPLTVAFTDDGVPDTHLVTVDWGDGNTDEADTDGPRSVEFGHAYQRGGIYTITVTVMDDDGGVDQSQLTAYVTGVGIQSIDGVNVLQIVGTSHDDHVSVNQQGNGTLRVHTSFIEDSGGRLFSLSDVDQIVALMCDGDDHLTIAGNVNLPSLLDMGDGDDHVNGGGGNDIVLGGAGDDVLLGNGGRDLLFGGLGADRLVGGADEDLLFGGAAALSASLLADIQDIWNLNLDSAERADAISDLAGFLTSLSEDDESDELTGSGDTDWLLTHDSDRSRGAKKDLATKL